MAKRSRAVTSAKVTRMIKEGRGQGHGRDYIPWLTIRDVPSEGLSVRIKGWTTKRVHHLLSKNELHYFYVLDWSRKIIDIREQYPLPIEETLEIAERLGIKHPIDIKTKEVQVITTDFLVDIEIDGNLEIKARTVKPKGKLAQVRTIEKFEIERTFWKEKGVDWGIVTEDEIPNGLVENIKWIHSAKDLENSPGISPGILLQVEKELFDRISKPGILLAHAALEVDDKLGLEPGSSLWVVRHLIATRQWLVDIYKLIDTGKPLNVMRAKKLEIAGESRC